VPTAALDGQQTLFAAWTVAAVGLGVTLRLLARP
jgi:hypothetical protein